MDGDPKLSLLALISNSTIGEIEIASYLIILTILLILSGLVSGSEVAFFSFNSQQILECASSEKKKDRIIAKLLLDPKRLLATILIFNNLVNVAMVTIATFFTWQLIGKEGFWASFIPTVLITILLVFFGEILPKVYANNNRVIVARFTASMLNTVNTLFYFIAFPLMKLSNLIEKRINAKGYEVSVDQLNEAIELATNDETTEEEKDILKGIVNFSNIQVRQIMCARTDIFALSVTEDFHEVMNQINKCQYSRIPVYNETLDELEGILHVKDLLPFLNNDENFNWKILLRKVYYVPETKMIDHLMRSFQEKRVHMAIVIDEYGGTSGLITLEDIIEEIVGDINDEFDSLDLDFKQIDENTYIFEGKTALTDIIKILDLKHDIFDGVKGENESIGGLLLELNSIIPLVNEEFHFSNFTFKVESVNTRRINKIRMTIHEEPQIEHNEN